MLKQTDNRSLVRAAQDHARQVAPVLGSLLAPVAFAGYAMALWRIGADMKWTGDFLVSGGLLSRWQVWAALAAAMQIGARQLNRPGRSDTATP